MSTILSAISEDFFTSRENEIINYIRQVLNDTDNSCQIFDDAQLLQYADLALMDINSHPMKTFYTLESAPKDWLNLIVLGAYIWALNAQGIIEMARNFQINDQGISWQAPQLPQHMFSVVQFMETKYQAEVERVKANEKPLSLGLGTSKVLGISNVLNNQRHLRAHRLFSWLLIFLLPILFS